MNKSKNQYVTLVSGEFKNASNPPHFSKTFVLGVAPKKLGLSPSLSGIDLYETKVYEIASMLKKIDNK